MTHGDRGKLAGLGQLSELVWKAEQARLAKVAAREQSLRQRLAHLDASRRSRAEALSAGPDAARLAGVDPQWEQWIAVRRAALMSELARVLAEKEAARQSFARARGRKEVAARLLERARLAARARDDYS